MGSDSTSFNSLVNSRRGRLAGVVRGPSRPTPRYSHAGVNSYTYRGSRRVFHSKKSYGKIYTRGFIRSVRSETTAEMLSNQAPLPMAEGRTTPSTTGTLVAHGYYEPERDTRFTELGTPRARAEIIVQYAILAMLKEHTSRRHFGMYCSYTIASQPPNADIIRFAI